VQLLKAINETNSLRTVFGKVALSLPPIKMKVIQYE
jgi:hypothetical protein